MRRASCQSGDLCAFYGALASSHDDVSAGIGRAMLELLTSLEPLCAMYDVWGLTSLNTLVLLAEDDFRSPWYVRVVGLRGYEIRYLMHPDEAPWPDAVVAGEGDSVADAVAMIETAMVRSGGWRPSRASGPA
jgi:hypothetical protein